MTKIDYPTGKEKGRMLVVRDCVAAICLRNDPASKLLSTFLYWYDRSPDDCSDGLFTIKRTQAELSEDACDLIDAKTIHDTAIPFLQLFGYLTIQDIKGCALYTINIKRVEEGIAAFVQGPDAVRSFLRAQLESALIPINKEEIESVLNRNKSRLYLELERVLILNRAGSNSKRGRKPRSQANSEANSETIENRENNRDSNRENSATRAHSSLPENKSNLKVKSSFPQEVQDLGKESNSTSATRTSTKSSQEKNTKVPRKTGLDALCPEDRNFWDNLWLKVDQNEKVPPQYKNTAYDHIQALRPYIKTLEMLQSLVDFTRKKMSELLKRKIWRVELGNLRTWYSEWDRIQQMGKTENQLDGEASLLPLDAKQNQRVMRVYDVFDQLLQEVTQDTSEHYPRTEEDNNAILKWLTTNPTEKLLRDVFEELWKTPENPRTHFSWQNNMTIQAVLRQYTASVIGIKARQNRLEAKHVVTASTNLPTSSYRPPAEEEDDLPFAGPSINRKRTG